MAGNKAYLWARVSNTGSSAALGARIDFYWANPSAQMVVGVATRIGSAYADLAPGATRDVLCLTPWRPVIVNTHGRHDPCVGIRATPIAEAMLALVLADHALRHRAQNADVVVATPRVAASAPPHVIEQRRRGAAIDDPDPDEA